MGHRPGRAGFCVSSVRARGVAGAGTEQKHGARDAAAVHGRAGLGVAGKCCHVLYVVLPLPHAFIALSLLKKVTPFWFSVAGRQPSPRSGEPVLGARAVFEERRFAEPSR